MQKNLTRAQEIVNQIVDIKEDIEVAKGLYETLDTLLVELAEVAEVNHTLLAANGLHVTLVDNFAEKNVVYRPAAVKRFDVEVLTTEELDKKRAKVAKLKKVAG